MNDAPRPGHFLAAHMPRNRYKTDNLGVCRPNLGVAIDINDIKVKTEEELS
jgi:hypothetical protein